VGATYYITQSGSGAHDGTTYANSDSIAHHNAATYAADDIIYLCDTITSTVIPPSSGTSGHPIIYRGDYAAHAGILNGAVQRPIYVNGKSFIKIGRAHV
jgi:hypothetical protein